MLVSDPQKPHEAVPTPYHAAPKQQSDDMHNFVYSPTQQFAPATSTTQMSQGFKDPIFAIAFLAQAVGIVIVAVVLFLAGDFHQKTDTNGSKHGLEQQDANKAMALAIASFPTAVIFSLFFLWFARKFATVLIYVTLWGGAILTTIFGIGLIGAGQPFGIVFLILGIIGCLYAFLVRNRIPFASRILQKSVGIINAHPTVIVVCYFAQIFVFGWLIVWAMAAVGVQNSGKTAIYAFLLLSLYWGLEVIQNVCHVTVAGVAASVLFQSANPSNNTVGDSAKRALTTSFGSVCFGSLLIAIVRTLRALLRSARNQRQENAVSALVLCCIDCLLSYLEAAARYFNKYAFVHVAMYGKDFLTSARDTWQMFQTHGIDALINDDLTGGVLNFGALVVATVNGGIWSGIAFAVLGKTENLWLVIGVVGFLFGLACCVTINSVIVSCSCTIFVCFAEQPEMLAQNDPEFAGFLQNALQIARGGNTEGGALLPGAVGNVSYTAPQPGYQPYA